MINNVKILPDAQATTTSGGIIIPPTVKQAKSKTGTVLQVGSKVEYLKKGDRVVYEPVGYEVTDEEGTSMIVEDRHVLALLN